MKKDTSYKEKIAQLNDYFLTIIEAVKKDLKNDHLKQDFAFLKQYLSGKNINKIETSEMADAYYRAIQEHEKGESYAEFIANRWILKKSDLYYFFENELSQVNPNFTEIEELEDSIGKALLDKASLSFGSSDLYIFSHLNSVAFSERLLNDLKEKVVKEICAEKMENDLREEKESLEVLKRNHEREMARVTDKFEKKLLGLQRKYHQDVDMLKKQIANLQKKLSSPS